MHRRMKNYEQQKHCFLYYKKYQFNIERSIIMKSRTDTATQNSKLQRITIMREKVPFYKAHIYKYAIC